MINEIGAGVGGALTIGGAMAMFKFLNNKIDKKQDKTLCEEIAKTFGKAIDKGDKNHEKVMGRLGIIEVGIGEVKQELKHFNGKT